MTEALVRVFALPVVSLLCLGVVFAWIARHEGPRR